MSNTSNYFSTVQKWREGLRSINSVYDERRKNLERFKGSAGYDSDWKDLEAERAEEIKTLRVEVGSAFQSTIADMRTKAGTSRPFAAPTQEQLAILQALKMCPQLSVETLNRAAVSMDGNSLCLSVLDGIAHEAGHDNRVRYNTEPSQEEILNCISSLEKDAWSMLRFNKTDCRRDNCAPGGDITLYRIDVDPKDLGDCLSRFGNVKNVDGFCAVVD